MIARTPEARREAAANELKDRMSAISQRGCADGWAEGLEFALWTLVRRGGGTYGRTAVTVTEVGTLRALSQRCGGPRGGLRHPPAALRSRRAGTFPACLFGLSLERTSTRTLLDP